MAEHIAVLDARAAIMETSLLLEGDNVDANALGKKDAGHEAHQE
jgi:hypothetical protein